MQMRGSPMSKPAKVNLEKDKVPSCSIVKYGVNLKHLWRCIFFINIYPIHFHSEEVKKATCRFRRRVNQFKDTSVVANG